MALSGTVLKGNLKTAILAQIQVQFPAPAGLLSAELTSFNSYQSKLAQAIADGDGPTTVTHITTLAVVNTADTGSVTSGAGSGGSVVATGVGTVS